MSTDGVGRRGHLRATFLYYPTVPRTLRRGSVPGPSPAFEMAQELTFTMLAHALPSTRDCPNLYDTILLTFRQTVLRHPEGLAMFERAIPWTDLATFLSRGPRVLSNYMQTEKLGKSSILPEDWAMRGMV